MTITFTPDLSDDVSYIRFHIGDTNVDGAYLQDETIQAIYDEAQDYGVAIVSCIRYIITQLSSPNFSKDWLSVSNGEARQGYETMLKEKKIEFGVSSLTAVATIALPYREDSDQDSSVSTYTDDKDTADEDF